MADDEEGDKKPATRVTVTYAGETIVLQDDTDVDALRKDVFNAVRRGGEWVELPVAKGEYIVFVTAGTAVTVQSQQRSSKPRMARVI